MELVAKYSNELEGELQMGVRQLKAWVCSFRENDTELRQNRSCPETYSTTSSAPAVEGTCVTALSMYPDPSADHAIPFVVSQPSCLAD